MTLERQLDWDKQETGKRTQLASIQKMMEFLPSKEQYGMMSDIIKSTYGTILYCKHEETMNALWNLDS